MVCTKHWLQAQEEALKAESVMREAAMMQLAAQSMSNAGSKLNEAVAATTAMRHLRGLVQEKDTHVAEAAAKLLALKVAADEAHYAAADAADKAEVLQAEGACALLC